MQHDFSLRDRTAHTRSALHAAREVLEREGSWHALTMPLLFFLLCAFACYLFTAILQILLFELTILSEGAVLALYAASVLLCCVLLLFPLLLGRLRIAGLLSLGERPLPKACFYYFSAPRRYLRALWLGSAYVLSLLLPLALLLCAAVLPYLLFEAVLYPYLITGVAVLLLIVLYPAGLALAVFLLWLLGRLAFAVPLAVANEHLGLLAALRLSAAYTKKNTREPFALFWQSTWRFLLSCCTLFVLWALYYASALDVAYFELARKLSSKR